MIGQFTDENSNQTKIIAGVKEVIQHARKTDYKICIYSSYAKYVKSKIDFSEYSNENFGLLRNLISTIRLEK